MCLLGSYMIVGVCVKVGRSSSRRREQESEKELGENRAQRKPKGIGKWSLLVTTNLQRIPGSSGKEGLEGKGQKDT